jgi:anti-sigma regulatory factor (Ser/Thr protein kinase)
MYAPKPESVRSARWYCIDYLRHVLVGADEAIESILDDARLVVSELVTNAVQADSGEVGLQISASGRYVRIVVSDTGSGEPVAGRPQATTEHGRGLWIVGQTAQRWGITSVPGGKQVWAEIPLGADIVSLDDQQGY